MSMPSLDLTGSLVCSGSALIAGPLYIAGTNVMDAIANASSSTINANTQLAVAGVTATGGHQR